MFGNFSLSNDQGQTPSNSATNQPSSSEILPPPSFNLGRRSSISSEVLHPSGLDGGPNWEPPVYKKTTAQIERLKSAVLSNFLFSRLEPDQLETILNALQEKIITSSDVIVITQGDSGDQFYVVETGTLNFYVNQNGSLEPGPNGRGDQVGTVGPGGSFGELALMYNASRAATVVTAGPVILWALDRITFRRILMEKSFAQRKLYTSILEDVPLLSTLTVYERNKILDSIECHDFEHGAALITEGDVGDTFYILLSGLVDVFKSSAGPNPIHTYHFKGDYFGELALLDDKPRAASVIARTQVRVATLNKGAFQRLLGPLADIMRRNDPRRAGQVKLVEIDNDAILRQQQSSLPRRDQSEPQDTAN